VVFRGPVSERTSEAGNEPTGDRPRDLDEMLSHRREGIFDRIAQLQEREQQLVDRLASGRTPGSLREAEAHAVEAKTHAAAGHVHAAQAHQRASRRHTEAAELHERVGHALETRGQQERAQAHRKAAEQDREAAEAQQQAANDE
jgi:hypothetical protein